jgi:hypothetical protein
VTGKKLIKIVASKSIEHAKIAQKIFHNPKFRVYTSLDVVGVEVSQITHLGFRSIKKCYCYCQVTFS